MSFPNQSRFDRRDFIRKSLLGAGAMVSGSAAFGQSKTQSKTLWTGQQVIGAPAAALASSCTLTASDVQGPFWVNSSLLRQDITEGLVGFPLTVYVQVNSILTCAPIQGAVVDLWHDDPEGAYSGFASQGTSGMTYLRGIQFSDQNGLVRFDTIYPGWYPGRTPHLHLKINPNAGQELTTQLYLDDNMSNRVFITTAPYDTRGPSPVTNDTDAFFNSDLKTVMYYDPIAQSLVAGKRIVIA